jgi:hypothetical protein
MHAKLGPKGIVKRSRRYEIISGPQADLCTLMVSRRSGSVRPAGSETTCSERDSLGTRIQCLHFPLIFHRTSSGKNVAIVNSLLGIYRKQNKTKSGYSARGYYSWPVASGCVDASRRGSMLALPHRPHFLSYLHLPRPLTPHLN